MSHPFTPNTPLTRPRVTHFVGFALTAESQGAPTRYAAAGVARCLLEQIRDPLRGLSPVSHPVVDAAEIDAQSLFAAGCDRVEEPDALDVTPAAWHGDDPPPRRDRKDA